MTAAGSHAAGASEPRQARKGATVRGTSWVPWGCLVAVFNSRGGGALDLVDQFLLVGRDLHEGGLVTSHGGNLSARVGERLIITRSGAMLGHLTEKDLVSLSLEEEYHPGASRELPLHRAVYLSTRARALVHAHPPYSVALSFAMDWIEPVDAEGSLVLPRVPVVEVERPIGSQEVAEAVAEALRESPMVVVRGHGSFARGWDLLEAYHYTSVLEASARILWLLRGFNPPSF